MMFKVVLGSLFGNSPERVQGLMIECGDQVLSVRGADGKFPPYVSVDLGIEEDEQLYFFIGEQIEKIRSPELHHKYKIGQQVWRLNDEYEPQAFVVSDIDEDADETYLLDDNGGWWIEEQLYESRHELIEE